MLRTCGTAILTAIVLGALTLSGCSKVEDSPLLTDNSTTTDVTLSGAMTVASSTASAGSERLLSSAPGDYVLYCVTFTNPPKSGTGSFDVSGNFSVTITDAANLPIGCFINDATTNTAVTTITFQVGGDGLSNTSGSVALDGGSYAVAIHFDPTSGVATVDVSQTTQSPGAATFQPASLVGIWRMTCVDTDPAGPCVKMIGSTALDLYMDVITASENGASVYAMGIWRDRATFITLGATEGIEPSIVPSTITDVRSLNSDVTSPAPSATNPFTGFTSHAGFSRITNKMNGNDVLAELSALGIPYDHTFNDSSLGSGDTDFCTAGAIDLTQQTVRRCLLDYLNYIHDINPPVGFSNTVPRVHPASFKDFADNGADATALIQFLSTKVGDSPDISARYGLMGLHAVGDSGVAQDFSEYTYTQTDPGTNTQVNCKSAEELTIVMTITSDTSALGRFTQRGYDSCSGNNSFATFETNFSRP